MTPHEWDDMLRRSAQDLRLSGAERSALAEHLAGATEQQVAALRARAFEVLRGEDFTPRQQGLHAWLEEVVKLLHPIRPAASFTEALFSPEDDLVGRVIGLFDAARSSADVCEFTITDDRITSAILRAHGRGLRLRVITDDQKAHDLGADVFRLREAGVPLITDRSEAHMHHKFAVFDRATLLNGSYNWTRSAQAVNRENVVVTNDRRLVETFGSYFNRLWTELGGTR